MTDPMNSIECCRYEFHNGTLKQAQPLKRIGKYLNQSREDFLEYCKEFKLYLKRLANIEPSVDSCPFCTLTIDTELNAYININSSKIYPFVDKVKEHLKLWREGVIIISNPNGWHLISEIIIPKEHVTNLNSILRQSNKLLECCISRWYIHRREISKLLPTDVAQNLYHGIVLNQRAGQSVSHYHYHCYTTIHPLLHLQTWIDSPTIGKTMTSPSFEIHVSVDDHPNLIAITTLNIHQNNLKKLTKLTSLMISIADIFRIIQIDLYGCEIPASIGWFLLFEPNPYLIHTMIPMKRHGTVQAFQGDKFRKFNTNVIISSIKSILSQRMNQISIPIQLYEGLS